MKPAVCESHTRANESHQPTHVVIAPLEGDGSLLETNSQGVALGWIVSAFQAATPPEGRQDVSPGQRPGEVNQPDDRCPERAQQERVDRAISNRTLTRRVRNPFRTYQPSSRIRAASSINCSCIWPSGRWTRCPWPGRTHSKRNCARRCIDSTWCDHDHQQ